MGAFGRGEIMCDDQLIEEHLNDWVASGAESPKIPNERLSIAKCVEDLTERVKKRKAFWLNLVIDCLLLYVISISNDI
jgi:hypothetical protein